MLSGVVAMISAILVLFLLPMINTSETRIDQRYLQFDAVVNFDQHIIYYKWQMQGEFAKIEESYIILRLLSIFTTSCANSCPPSFARGD